MYNIFNQRFPLLTVRITPESVCDITGIRSRYNKFILLIVYFFILQIKAIEF
jgi:hypothetical protein